jgi:hypothetical protein
MSEERENLEPGGLSSDERQVERFLASLPVRDSGLDRDRTMFLAGRATALALKQRQPRTIARWIWPGVTICSTAAGLLVGLLIAEKGPVAGVQEHDVTQAVVPPRATSEAIVTRIRDPWPASSEREDAGLDSSASLLALRARLFGEANGAPGFVEDNKLALAAGRAHRREAPVTYRDFIGHLPDEVEHPRL